MKTACIENQHLQHRGSMNSLTERLWRNTSEGPALVASKQLSSGELIFPPLLEQSPLADAYVTTTVPPSGVVYSYTIVHPNAKTGQAPYALALIDLQGPVRLFGRLDGGRRPEIGDRVHAVPDDTLGYVFHFDTAGAIA